MSESSIQIDPKNLIKLIEDYIRHNEECWKKELAGREEYWREKEAKYNKTFWPKIRNFFGLTPKKFNYTKREINCQYDFERGTYKYRKQLASEYMLLLSQNSNSINLLLSDLKILTSRQGL